MCSAAEAARADRVRWSSSPLPARASSSIASAAVSERRAAGRGWSIFPQNISRFGVPRRFVARGARQSMSAPPPRRANTAFTVGRGLTAEEREDIADAFRLCADLPPEPPPGERPVALSRHGLACAMISLLGYKPASVETKMLFGQHARPLQQPASQEAVEDDADHDDRDARTGVSLAGFEALMSQKYRFQDVDEKSRQIFRQFDHGKGYITVDDAVEAFKKTVPYVSQQTVRDVYYEADSDRHGKVSYLQFRQILSAP